MSVRVYLPATSSSVAGLVADRRLVGPLRCHAVTPALRAAWPDGDEEAWEYAALMAAAADSASLRRSADAPRRHVVAADVPTVVPVGTAVPDEELTLVEVAGVEWREVASLHLDTRDDADEDDDLAWYATQEIAELVAPGPRADP